MLVTSLITIIIILACVVLLSVKILLKKDGKFPDTHIEGHKRMREKGIRCDASQDYELRSRKNLAELLEK